ncbi:ammonia/ammonium transporter [Gammaproteobacteria bacterium]
MTQRDHKTGLQTLGIFLLTAVPLLATAADVPPAPAPILNSGDTAWMLTSTAFVLFMTIPGLALFYGGLVRTKNMLSVLMQCFAITCLVTVLWAIYGYSVAFDTTGMVKGEINLNAIIGSLAKVFLRGIEVGSLWQPDTTVSNAIPETVFMMYQMTFAIITPALIVGAFAERMKFSALLWFMGAWLTLVYLPVAHMVWSGAGSLLGDLGVLDFAGGTVVHVNAGMAALVAALMLGRRKGFPTTAMPPHNLGLTVVGAAMLWVGWFGFNAGSAVAANGTAGMAMAVTQIATASAALAWMFVEWMVHGKPSVLGIVTGAVAGLVAITPAAGFVGPMGAIAIGSVGTVFAFLASTKLKRALGYDDSLDVFGVHGIAGIVGALLTGVFAASSLGGSKVDLDIGAQVMSQAFGVGATIVYSVVMSFIILKVVDLMIGLRVTEEEETQGLDISQHDERGYNL